MNSRRLWNSHQRHKFLRAEASGDILKKLVSEMVFPEVFKRYFPLWTPGYFCFIRIHVRLGKMPSNCPRHSKTLHGLNGLNMRSVSFKTGKQMLYNFI